MRKVAIVGAGSRATHMFARPWADELGRYAALVGVCDTNPVRARKLSEEAGNIPVYADFDAMLREARPDAVIVTMPDSEHDRYIIRALEAGCDAVSEKPMTTSLEKSLAILDAERRTGRKVVVTFNCRFMPYIVRIKQLLDAGEIGTIRSVHLEWSLDRSHGADYFRRWHRQMVHSGGLLIHKATHHFDMVNWWLNDEPERVSAQGDLLFYGPNREERGERCLTCRYAAGCEFYKDIAANPFTKAYFLEAEHLDGYYRDRCVFGEDIDIYDTMSLSVKYRRGALLAYSLQAYSPYEGWKAVLTGDRGRLEASEVHSGPHRHEPVHRIELYRPDGERTTVRIEKPAGDHGGGDQRLRSMVFGAGGPDPLGQLADSRAGALSLLIGVAANHSIVSGRAVDIPQL